MMDSMYPMVMGFHLDVLLMLVSGIFYLICALVLIKAIRREKNELLNALFAFLLYQAFAMFFMGMEMHTMNMVYGNIASLAVFVGSAYMLKFPLSKLSMQTRRILFLLILVAALAVFAWFMQTPERQMSLMHFVLWYDLVANGIIVGGSIIFFGIKAAERSAKRKALGGGSGVVSCCIAANSAMLGGAMLTSAVFQFLAPVLILLALKSRKTEPASTASASPAAPAATA